MPEKMRVVIVSGSFPPMPCGVGAYVKFIAERLNNAGDIDLHVLTSEHPEVNVTRGRRFEVHPDVSQWTPWRSGRIAGQILALNPQVVHMQMPTMAYKGWRGITLGRVAKELRRMAPELRQVVMQHDIAISLPTWRRRYRLLLQQADRVLVSNSRDRRAIQDLGIVPEKIVRASLASLVKVHAMDTQAKAACRETLGVSEKTLCLVTFGFIHPGRHIDLLVQAVDRLNREGRDVRAIIVGGAAPGAETYLLRCQELSNRLGLFERITWTGYADDGQIADALAAGDVFVSLPNRGADLRNTTILTALQAGLPVVTTRNVRYYVDEEIEALGCVTIGTLSTEALAEAIETTRKNPPSVGFRQAVAEKLSPQRVWPEHIQAILKAYGVE